MGGLKKKPSTGEVWILPRSAKCLKEHIYEPKLVLSRGTWGLNLKKTFVGEVLIFSGSTQRLHVNAVLKYCI